MGKNAGRASGNLRRSMELPLCGAAVAIPLAVLPASGQQLPVKFAIVNELTGNISGPGTNMKDAVLQAVDEINAKGGILGRKIETAVYDTQSDPPKSIAVMRWALKDKPFVVLGPVLSVPLHNSRVVSVSNKRPLVSPPPQSLRHFAGHAARCGGSRVYPRGQGRG